MEPLVIKSEPKAQLCWTEFSKKSLRIICNKADEEKLAQHCFSLHCPPNIVIKAALTNTDTWKSPCHYNSWTNICHYILYTNLYYPAHSTTTVSTQHTMISATAQSYRSDRCSVVEMSQHTWNLDHTLKTCGWTEETDSNWVKQFPEVCDPFMKLLFSQMNRCTSLHNNTHIYSHTLVSTSNWRNAFKGRWL